MIYLDIESLPSGDPIDPLTMPPPGNISKAETVAEWRRTKAVDLAADKYRARALDSMAGEIFCIAWAIDDGPVDYVSIETGDEVDRMVEFQDVVKSLGGQYNEPVQFCGFNILNFDMPFLWRKSVKYGLMLHKIINLDKYRGNCTDLMVAWGKYYRADKGNEFWCSAKSVAEFLGIPNDDPVDGSMVYDLYQQGNVDAIISHCKADVLLEREIYKRLYG